MSSQQQRKLPMKARNTVTLEPLEAVPNSQINKLLKAPANWDFRKQLSRPRDSMIQTNLIKATKFEDVKMQKIDLIYDQVRGDVHGTVGGKNNKRLQQAKSTSVGFAAPEHQNTLLTNSSDTLQKPKVYAYSPTT